MTTTKECTHRDQINEVTPSGEGCEECLKSNFAEAKRRQALCPLALDETLESPNIFEFASGSLQRRAELEA